MNEQENENENDANISKGTRFVKKSIARKRNKHAIPGTRSKTKSILFIFLFN